MEIGCPLVHPTHFKPSIPLETPNLGFAIAAPTLNLTEGERVIQVIFNLEKSIPIFNIFQLIDCIDVFATGEKGWLEPFKISASAKGFTSVVGNKTVQFCLKIDKTEKAIVPYNIEIHKENFETEQPVFRFLLKTKQPEFSIGYQLYTELLQEKSEKGNRKSFRFRS